MRKVTVFGGGSVGCAAVFYLANIGVEEIEVWDNKSIASHNIPMSMCYGIDDVGRKKVEVLREFILHKTGTEISIVPRRYTGQVPLRNTSVLSCVDKMRARSNIWPMVRDNPTIDFFGDTRVVGNYMEVLSIAPCLLDDKKRYRKLLFSDKVATKQSCGEHGTILIASAAANAAVQNLATFWQTGQKQWRVAYRRDTLERVF